MTYTPPIEPDLREEKLPRWARELLGNMRSRVERAERTAEAARLNTDPDQSDTVIYRYGDEPVGLGMGPCIEFRLGPNSRDYVHCYVERDKRGTRLHLWGDTIRIAPKSSNAVQITVNLD